MKRAVILVLALLLLTSCLTTARQRRNQEIQDMLGRVTYDDMLVKYGPPDRCAEGTSVTVCMWADEHIGPTTSQEQSYSYGKKVTTSSTLHIKRKMTLVFRKADMVLIEGDYKNY